MEPLKNWLRQRPLLFKIARSWLYRIRLVYGWLFGLVFNKAIWRSYVARHPVRKLHLGCGDLRFPGWLDTDAYPRSLNVAYCNCAGRFPFEDNSFDYVFSEHMIEHITFLEARRMIAECFRVLKPGGKLRISTPDLDKILALKRSDLSPLEQRYLDYALTNVPEAIDGQPSFFINIMVRAWGHTFIYDQPTFEALLRVSSFADITRYEPGESTDPALRSLERHGETFPDPEFNFVETMTFEATKPHRSLT